MTNRLGSTSRHSDDPSGYPFGSSKRRIVRFASLGYAGVMVLEIGVILLTIVCFVALDLYVTGCEKV